MDTNNNKDQVGTFPDLKEESSQQFTRFQQAREKIHLHLKALLKDSLLILNDSEKKRRIIVWIGWWQEFGLMMDKAAFQDILNFLPLCLENLRKILQDTINSDCWTQSGSLKEECSKSKIEGIWRIILQSIQCSQQHTLIVQAMQNMLQHLENFQQEIQKCPLLMQCTLLKSQDAADNKYYNGSSRCESLLKQQLKDNGNLCELYESQNYIINYIIDCLLTLDQYPQASLQSHLNEAKKCLSILENSQSLLEEKDIQENVLWIKTLADTDLDFIQDELNEKQYAHLKEVYGKFMMLLG